jgi:hypothetical protein
MIVETMKAMGYLYVSATSGNTRSSCRPCEDLAHGDRVGSSGCMRRSVDVKVTLDDVDQRYRWTVTEERQVDAGDMVLTT